MQTNQSGGRNAEAHRRSVESMARRERTDPQRVAARAAGHRVNAEAFLELAALRNKPHYIELAAREYQFAYDEEH
jgi:hypothetical protein